MQVVINHCHIPTPFQLVLEAPNITLSACCDPEGLQLNTLDHMPVFPKIEQKCFLISFKIWDWNFLQVEEINISNKERLAMQPCSLLSKSAQKPLCNENKSTQVLLLSTDTIIYFCFFLALRYHPKYANSWSQRCIKRTTCKNDWRFSYLGQKTPQERGKVQWVKSPWITHHSVWIWEREGTMHSHFHTLQEWKRLKMK